MKLAAVVSYSISTSNHNTSMVTTCQPSLYLIPFLHQTTTIYHVIRLEFGCILFHFYIKPQRKGTNTEPTRSCILFHFYIKPQRFEGCQKSFKRCILFHFYIKPQHIKACLKVLESCILFHFYIKPQPANSHDSRRDSCILFHFYIKPQPYLLTYRYSRVVSYSISTSNHNLRCCRVRT